MKPFYHGNGATIYHGDSRAVLDEIRHMTVGLVATSPPYNCGMPYDGYADSLSLPDYWALVEDVYHRCANALRPGGVVALNVPSWIGHRDERVYAIDEYRAIADRHLPFWDMVVWVKGPPNGTAWGNYPTSPMLRANHEWVMLHRAPGKMGGGQRHQLAGLGAVHTERLGHPDHAAGPGAAPGHVPYGSAAPSGGALLGAWRRGPGPVHGDGHDAGGGRALRAVGRGHRPERAVL